MWITVSEKKYHNMLSLERRLADCQNTLKSERTYSRCLREDITLKNATLKAMRTDDGILRVALRAAAEKETRHNTNYFAERDSHARTRAKYRAVQSKVSGLECALADIRVLCE